MQETNNEELWTTVEKWKNEATRILHMEKQR